MEFLLVVLCDDFRLHIDHGTRSSSKIDSSTSPHVIPSSVFQGGFRKFVAGSSIKSLVHLSQPIANYRYKMNEYYYKFSFELVSFS